MQIRKIDSIGSITEIIQPRFCLLFLLFISLIFPIYANTLNSQWQLDDEPNITWNIPLHINNLYPSTLYKTFFAHPNSEGMLYRPLPCLTFALNWHFGQKNPFGYHLINIFIHILTACVLYFCIFTIFRTPRLHNIYSEIQVNFISLLAAALWAVNPIQTQAVTYIVQRMTVLAALFYLLGLFFYIHARISENALRRTIYLLGCLLSFLCALGSKENSATFPLAILLIETAFFHKAIYQFFKGHILKLSISLFLFLAIAFYFSNGDLLFFTKYDGRPYDLIERLLTQPRVLLFYLTLIFYPLPQRLSIDHEFILSRSVFDPWTTLPAILIILIMISVGLLALKKKPLISFSILFFFFSHLVESTVIPLEMVFEHRNYLPSAFLFLPISLGLLRLLNYYRENKKYIFYAIILFSVSVIISFGIGTHTRNRAWANNLTLWTDAMFKAPGNARPVAIVAIDIGWRQNATKRDHEKALSLLKKCLSLNLPSRFFEAGMLANIGTLYFRKNEIENAMFYYQKAIETQSHIRKIRYDFALELSKLGRWEEANHHLDIILEKKPEIERYYSLQGFVLLWLNKPEEALSHLREALSLEPGKTSIWLNIGAALNRVESLENALWFLGVAKKRSGPDPTPYFYMVENRVFAHDIKGASKYARQILSVHSLPSVLNHLEMFRNGKKYPPISVDLIEPIIKEEVSKLPDKLR